MKYFLSFIMLLVTANMHAQDIFIDYTKFIGADSCHTNVNAAIRTFDGGIAFTGLTYCSGKGDLPQTSQAGQNVFVGRVDENSNIKWLKIFGGSATEGEFGKSICSTPGGGYAVLASTFSNDGDAVGSNNKETWLIRLDDNGNKLWSRFYGVDTGVAVGYSIACTQDSGFIILGVSAASGDDIPFQYGSSPFVYDWFVIKTDKNGNKQWVKVLGGNGDEHSEGSILVGNNCYYLVSCSNSRDNDCADTSWHSPSINTEADYYIIKLDISGSVLWSKSYGGSKVDVAVNAMFDDRDSSIVIAGYSSSNDYLATGNNGKNDMWIVKADKNGSFQWSTMCGGKEDEDFYATVAQGPNGGYITATRPNNSFFGETDIWFFALDNTGKISANKLIGGSSYENVSAILSNSDSYALVGASSSYFFKEGNNVGRHGVYGETFITKLHYFPMAISNIENTPKRLELYPNPTDAALKVMMPKDCKSGAMLSIYNDLGKVIAHYIVTETKEFVLNTAGWPVGLYYVVLKIDGETYSEKVIHR